MALLTVTRDIFSVNNGPIPYYGSFDTSDLLMAELRGSSAVGHNARSQPLTLYSKCDAASDT